MLKPITSYDLCKMNGRSESSIANANGGFCTCFISGALFVLVMRTNFDERMFN